MQKLIIQIPCLNEEKTLPAVIADLPRSIDGIDVIEYLVIDDGSTDNTVKVARENGVHHVISLGRNRGLAQAFTNGLNNALLQGATIIVNTDADNQYDASCIPDLIAPIVATEADMVVGTRPITDIAHFSIIKKLLQKAGSYAVRTLSGTSVEDAPSGMRAYSRDMAMRLFVHNNYTYTLETLIQAGQSGYRVVSVPIRVNGETRPSRLFRSNASYVIHSMENNYQGLCGVQTAQAIWVYCHFPVRYCRNTEYTLPDTLLRRSRRGNDTVPSPGCDLHYHRIHMSRIWICL